MFTFPPNTLSNESKKNTVKSEYSQFLMLKVMLDILCSLEISVYTESKTVVLTNLFLIKLQWSY